MEKYLTLEEYVATNMSDKITKKAKTPIMGLLILAASIALLVLTRMAKMSDSLQMLVLTIGIIALAVGIVLTAMCLTKTLWYYQYRPTKSKMKLRKHYLGSEDYAHCVEALSANNAESLSQIKPITTSNGSLSVLYSRDLSIALLQACHCDTNHIEAETPVVTLSGNELSSIRHLCR